MLRRFMSASWNSSSEGIPFAGENLINAKSFPPHRGELLAILHQGTAVLERGAIEPEHAVVGAAFEVEALVLRLVVAPDADRIEPHQRGLALGRQLDADAAAVAVDAATELRFVARVLRNAA